MTAGWFTDLTGLEEGDPDTIRAGLVVDGLYLTARITGRTMQMGRFDLPSLAQLRQAVAKVDFPGRPTRLREIFGDVRAAHANPANAGAVFQVASQFNMLEMVGPNVSPDAGINGYAHDHTQGPACAMACGAGTIWRQYLVPVGGGLGQTADRQLDGAADLHAALRGDGPPLWSMRNGYLWPEPGALVRVAEHLNSGDATSRAALMGTLRYGINWQTEVTDRSPGLSPSPAVTQIYCSAAPVAYAANRPADWAPLARLILDAAYEATLAVGVLNRAQTGSDRVILTRLGGGVFGNDPIWIDAALHHALGLFADAGLDVALLTRRG